MLWTRWYATDPSVSEANVLVIGYGNSLRRDDGAGLVLARLLAIAWQAEGLPVALITEHQLNPEIADDIARSGASTVLFVDATDSVDSPNAIITEAKLVTETDGGPTPSMGHHLSPGAVLIYARELFGWNGIGWMISVPGYDFAHGEGLGAKTQRLVDNYARRADIVWRKLHLGE
jgi:hydrogenase maturation protease